MEPVPDREYHFVKPAVDGGVVYGRFIRFTKGGAFSVWGEHMRSYPRWEELWREHTAEGYVEVGEAKQAGLIPPDWQPPPSWSLERLVEGPRVPLKPAPAWKRRLWWLRRKYARWRAISRATIRLPQDPTDDQVLMALRQWLAMVAQGDYRAATEAVVIPQTTPEDFRDAIERFCDPEHPVPAVATTEEVFRRTEIHRSGIGTDCKAVVGFFITLVNGWGIWTEFKVRSTATYSYFEFIIFHA